MVEQQFRIAEIEISKSPTDEKILGIFRYENNGRSKKSSTLLILSEISSTLYAYERLLDVINATAEQARHMAAGVEQDPIARFEKIIQRLNESIAAFLEGEPTPLAWNRVNIFVIELSTDHVCLTGLGRLMNVFLQKQEDGSFKTFDLFGSLEQPAEVNPVKPFASLICGDMKPGDVLIAGTTNLERLRNELRIKERLTTLPPVSAALEIKQDLEGRGIPDDFAAVVVACCALEMPSAIAAKLEALEKDRSTASINKLRETELDAAAHLSPAIAPSPAAPHAPQRGKNILAGALGLWEKTQRSLKKSDRIKDVAALVSLRGMNAGHGSQFTQKQKMKVLTIGLGVVVIVTSLLIWRGGRRTSAQTAAWEGAYAQAQDNRNRAESDLVYANDSRARKEIEDAEKILSTLSVAKKDRKQKVDALRGDIDQLKERLRKIVIAQPVNELVALNGAPAGSLTAPMLVKDTAYVADNSTNSILKIDITNKTTKRLALPAGAGTIVAGSLGKQSAVFASEAGKFYAVDTQTDTITPLATQPRSSSTTDLVLYAGRAYSLDGSAGQIWRAPSSGSGFGAETPYIKASDISLKNSVGLAIDSNVYVLKTDGTVVRFLSGGQEGFSLMPIDPPLKAASGIWTTAEATRLAISDPAGKRVVIYNKDGSLKSQVTSTDFTGPRDIDADETSKRLLVIDGTRLLLVPLP